MIGDITDRGKIYSKNIPVEELNKFFLNKNKEQRKNAF